MSTLFARRAALAGLVGATLAAGVMPAHASVAAPAAGTVPSRTVLVVTPSPLVSGQLGHLRGTVHKTGTGAAPTGTVTFLDGTTVVGTAPLAASPTGTEFAKLPHSFTAGAHSLTAHYNGDATYAPSTSPPVTITVGKAKSLSNLATVKATKAGTFNVVVAENAVKPGHGVPSGKVTIQVDSHAPQAVTLSASGHAHITLALAAGAHTAKVVYGGDSNFTANTGSFPFKV